MLQGVAGLQALTCPKWWYLQQNKSSVLSFGGIPQGSLSYFLIPSLWNIHKPGLVNPRKKGCDFVFLFMFSRISIPPKSLKCNVSTGKIFNLERIEAVRFLCIVIPVCDLVMNSLLGFSWRSGFNLYQPDPQKTSRIHSSWPLWTTNTSLPSFPQVTQVSRPKFKKQLKKQKLLNHHHSFFIHDHLSVN